MAWASSAAEPADARVLEDGSYTGAFLEAARDAGWRAIGVDVVTYARSRGLQVVQGQLPELALPRASFDAVFVWNCFDQVPEPRPLLEAAEALLSRLAAWASAGRVQVAPWIEVTCRKPG